VSEIVNLTEHVIRVSVGQSEFEFRPAGEVARVIDERIELEPIEFDLPIPAYTSRVIGLVGVPKPRPGTLYLVSSIVRKCVGRMDLVSPANEPGSSSKHKCVGFYRGGGF
jgi:hypothetical protein